jgi:hypothetical protein
VEESKWKRKARKRRGRACLAVTEGAALVYQRNTKTGRSSQQKRIAVILHVQGRGKTIKWLCTSI